jgi:hypothetical protein
MWAVHAVQERLARFWQQIGVVDAVRARDQLGEQRLGTKLGMSQPQPADGLKETVLGHARSPKAATHTARPKFGEEAA